MVWPRAQKNRGSYIYTHSLASNGYKRIYISKAGEAVQWCYTLSTTPGNYNRKQAHQGAQQAWHHQHQHIENHKNLVKPQEKRSELQSSVRQ